MLPDFFTHHPWPAIVGGLGLAVVWGAEKKKKGMMRALFFYVSATSVLKERKKKNERKRVARTKNYDISL